MEEERSNIHSTRKLWAKMANYLQIKVRRFVSAKLEGAFLFLTFINLKNKQLFSLKGKGLKEAGIL